MKKNEVIYGLRPLLEMLRAGRELEKIFVQIGNTESSPIKEVIKLARHNYIPLSFVPKQKLNHLYAGGHQGVIGILGLIQYAILEDLIDHAYSHGKYPFFMLLDRITDVRNFGAIARTAECAGLDGIVISKKEGALVTADAIKASAGALSRIPVCKTDDTKQSVQQLKEHGIKIIACTEKTDKKIYNTTMNTPLALLVGSEKDGVSPALLDLADELACIPMKKNIDSLNVSVAAGIAMYEAIRQKNS